MDGGSNTDSMEEDSDVDLEVERMTLEGALPGKPTGEGEAHRETVASETEDETPGQPSVEGCGLIEKVASETVAGETPFTPVNESSPRKINEEISRVNRKKSPSKKGTTEQKKGIYGEEQEAIVFVQNL